MFPTVTSFRRQFVLNMWTIQLTFLLSFHSIHSPCAWLLNTDCIIELSRLRTQFVNWENISNCVRRRESSIIQSVFSFLLSVVCRIFLSSLTLRNTCEFLTRSVQLIFSILLRHYISKFSRYIWYIFKSVPSVSTIQIYALKIAFY